MDAITDILIRRQTIAKIVTETMNRLRKKAEDRFRITQSTRKQHKLEAGDRVYMKDRTTAGRYGKMSISRFFGPYVVVSISYNFV